MPFRTRFLLAMLAIGPGVSGCDRSAVPLEPAGAAGFAMVPGGELDAMDAGYVFTCALNRRGDAFCWGNDVQGEVGDGVDPLPLKTTPSAVAGGLSLRVISAGGDQAGALEAGHACGIDRMRKAHCWGHGAEGRLGNGSTTDQHAPVAIAPAMSWLDISAGGTHTCGIDVVNAAWCWGNSTFGQRGDGTNTASATTPVVVSGGLAFASISSGGFHTCGVTTTGQGWCWGLGGNGQLGNGAEVDSNVPVPVAGGHVFVSIAVARFHTCGLTTAGQAWCWGFGLAGNLGDGTTDKIAQSTPVAVVGGLVFNQLVSGSAHTCGLTAAGAAYCWGQGPNGERGDGSNVLAQASPVAVVGGIVFRKLTAGFFHTCGSTNPGPAYCWGDATHGALGDGGGPSSNVPVAVIYP